MIQRKLKYPASFKVFSFALLFLTLGGMLILFSASTRVAYSIDGNANSFFESHLKYLILSLLLGAAFYLIDYQVLKKYSWLFFIITFALLLMALIQKFSSENSKTVRWFSIGGRNLFQLAELVKFTLIIYVSAYIANHKEKLGDFRKGLLPVLTFSLILIMMIALTPDFSSALSLFLIIAIMLYISGASLAQLGIVSAVLFLLSTAFIWFSAYRRERIIAFFTPGNYSGGNYQIRQSLISLSGGGFWGRGFGNSTGKNLFLPEAHTDFIFSIAGEELGFLATFFILALFVTLFLSMLRLAKQVDEPFGKILLFATAFSITFYALINAAVCVGLGPVTGLPMPFVSKSGSQLLINFALIGICLNVIRQSQYSIQRNTEALYEL